MTRSISFWKRKRENLKTVSQPFVKLLFILTQSICSQTHLLIVSVYWGGNGPFAASGHMVHAGGQAAHWDIQNRKFKFILMKSLCFGCPSGQLALQHVPCDR